MTATSHNRSDRDQPLDRVIQPDAPGGLPGSVVEEDGISLVELGRALRRRSRLAIAVAVLVTGGVWSFTLFQYFVRPTYEARFQLLIKDPTDDGSDGNSAALSQAAGLAEMAGVQVPREVDADTLVEVLASPSLLNPLASKLVTAPTEGTRPLTPEQRYLMLSRRIRIEKQKKSEILSVSVTDRNPLQAERMADQLATAYVSYSLEQRQKRAQQGIDFLNRQFPPLRQRVDQLSRELQIFQQQNAIVVPEDQGKALREQITTLEVQRQTLKVEEAKQLKLAHLLARQLGRSPIQALQDSQLGTSSRYQNLLNELGKVEQDLAVNGSRFTPSDPVMVNLRAKRSALRRQLAQEARLTIGQDPGRIISVTPSSQGVTQQLTQQYVTVSNELLVNQTQQQALEQAIAALQQDFSRFPELARRYAELQRELQIANQNLTNFITSREQLRLNSAQRINPWQIIAPPTVDPNPVSPKLPTNFALGLVAGLVAGVGAALLRDRFDHVFHSPLEVREEVPLPLLGTIPYNDRLQDIRKAKTLEQSLLTTLDSDTGRKGYYYATASFQEAFRTLYTNLRFLGADSPIRSIALTSSVPGEGKSTVNLLLARTAAELGQRVLLVDADLRRPQLHIRLDLDNLRGLSNLLTSSLDPAQVIQTVEPNFDVLTAGQRPPDPSKLLSSERMASLVRQFSGQYDLIIYDVPPLLGMADAGFLTNYLDGVIVIVSLGKVDRQAPKEVIESLRFRGIPVLGAIANAMSPKVRATAAGGYYYAYKGYDYYGYNRYYQTDAERETAKAAEPWYQTRLQQLRRWLDQ